MCLIFNWIMALAREWLVSAEGYNYIGSEHFFFFFLRGSWLVFPSSIGFLKKYLLFSLKRMDQVLQKMIIFRGQRLFCAEAFLISPQLGERGDIKNVWAGALWCDGITSNATKDLLYIICRGKNSVCIYFSLVSYLLLYSPAIFCCWK